MSLLTSLTALSLRQRGIILLVAGSIFGILLLMLSAQYFHGLNESPKTFPVEIPFTVSEGATVSEVARALHASGYTRSVLYTLYTFQSVHADGFVQAGTYQFTEPLTTQELTNALTSGTHLSPALRATFPEGFRVAEIERFLPEPFTFDTTVDLTEHEGYLFPDTYFLSASDTTATVIRKMRDTFAEKTAHLSDAIAASSLTEAEVITLASIVEREANTEESMRLVAGILLTRLSIDMPLQVDATFDYLLGKESLELTTEDLEMDSPYNTYLYAGLPPTPIANPGLQAIEAVLNPLESEYLYYLTGKDGNFYYAETFAEHRENKERYLR